MNFEELSNDDKQIIGELAFVLGDSIEKVQAWSNSTPETSDELAAKAAGAIFETEKDIVSPGVLRAQLDGFVCCVLDSLGHNQFSDALLAIWDKLDHIEGVV